MMDWSASQNKLIKLYKPHSPNDWSGIIWPGNGTSVPKDTPECGWNNELCESEDENNQSVTITVVCLVFVTMVTIVIIGLYVLRKRRYETKLAQVKNALIKWEQLKSIGAMRETMSVISLGKFSLRRKSLGGGMDNTEYIDPEHVYFYNDRKVYITKLGDNPLNMADRNVLVDLKEMMELNYENIVPFVGVCNDPGKVYILMDYAAKGSLYEIIALGETKFDWDFKMSILNDVARGMSFLHQSSFGCHGTLTSHKCVVNSKWVCQITGHGMGYIKRHKVPDEKNMGTNSKELWVAPEVLRNTMIPGKFHVRKADVYSYGIIAHEVLFQTQPYGCETDPDIEEKVIIRKVKCIDGDPYRPKIPEGKCSNGWIELMQLCWCEDPDERPRFPQVLSHIRRLNSNKSIALVDTMVHRLEVYANHLEVRVAERSMELQEERV